MKCNVGKNNLAIVLDTGFGVWLRSWCGGWFRSWRILDASDQNLKQQSRIGLEKSIVDALSVLGGRLRKLVVVSGRKDCRGWQNDSSQSIPVHSHHGFLEFWWELPASDRPGDFIEFRVGLGREVLDASWLVGGGKGLASNRHFNSNLGSIRNHYHNRWNL